MVHDFNGSNVDKVMHKIYCCHVCWALAFTFVINHWEIVEKWDIDMINYEIVKNSNI